MNQASPYIGLRAFKRDETHLFFGRETHTNQLIDKLQAHHFLAVIGPSGCGKSSLVKTGLLSALESGYMRQAGANWIVVDMRPGDRPYYHLTNALLKDPQFSQGWHRFINEADSGSGDNLESHSAHEQDNIPDNNPNNSSENSPENTPINNRHKATDPQRLHRHLQAQLQRGSRSLIALFHTLRQGGFLPEDVQLLLLVDQFEEIFRYRQHHENEAAAFVALLLKSLKGEP